MRFGTHWKAPPLHGARQKTDNRRPRRLRRASPSQKLVERIPGLRVLLIVTFRPEFEAAWIGRPHVTVLGWRNARSAP